MKITYRLNEAATSVDVAISNGTHLAGGTLKGLNTMEYAPPVGGLTGTITATGAAENGTGGAVQLIPATLVSDEPATNSYISGIDWFKRSGSPQRGHIAIIAGYGTASGVSKRVDISASDGSILLHKDISAYGAGSYPFGVAVAQDDPADRVWIASRSTGYVQIFNSSASPIDLTTDTTNFRMTGTSNNYMGMSVVRDGTDPTNTAKFSMYMGDNKNGRARHHTADFSAATPVYTAATPTTVAQSNTSGATGNDDAQAIAVDGKSKVMFKAQVHDSGVGAISELDPANTGCSANLNKWVSTDGGLNWTMDTTWSAAIIGAGGIPETAASAYGVALDKGFDADNIAGSAVWISIGGGSPVVRKIYHVTADTGQIIAADTIDLSAVTAGGTIILSDKFPRYISASHKGNLAVVVGAQSAASGAYWTVLAPNSAGPTTDTSDTFAVAVPLLVSGATTSRASLGNSGFAQTTYTVSVYDPSGIKADNVQATIDLSQIGGNAAQALTVAVGSDPNTGTLTYVYTVPSSAAAGSFDLPVHVTASGGKSLTSSISQAVYNALKPNWVITTDAGVNSSPVVSGKYAYIGTDGGRIYAFDATSGAPLTAFCSNGVVTVGEPVKNKLQVSDGKLFAAGTAHVFIMDAGTGRAPVSGATPISVAIATPSIALVANSTDANVANRLFVGGGDNKVHLFDATTGAALKTSADLGARIFNVAIGPTTGLDGSSVSMDYLVVAGTDTFTDASSVVGGRIHMLSPIDLSDAVPANPSVAFVDAKGAVKSRASFGKNSSGANYFAIGGATGLWGVNADTGLLLGDGADIWGTTSAATSAGANGNPYATSTPVDANPVVGKILPTADSAIFFATTGGSLYGISANTGDRFSYAGDPAALTTAGGYAAGGGVLTNNNTQGATSVVRMVYAGSDAADQKFFAQLRDQDSSSYVVTPDKKYIFDPGDTLTFPTALGYAPGAFNSTPAMACGNVVVGSAPGTGSGKVYGFPSINLAPICVAAVDPLPGAYSVPAAKVIRVTFSSDINAGTVSTDTLRVYTTSGTLVAGTVAQDAVDTKSFTFTPSNSLAANTGFYIDLSGAQDNNNVPIDDFTSTFNTGAAPVTVVKGDVNADGVFDARDVKAALQIAAGLTAATKDAVTAGDLYKPGSKTPDGKITIEDALFLSRVLVGKDTLP